MMEKDINEYIKEINEKLSECIILVGDFLQKDLESESKEDDYFFYSKKITDILNDLINAKYTMKEHFNSFLCNNKKST